MNTKETTVPNYRLNVDPDREHELTDAEVRDMRAMGFKVTPVGRSAAPKQAPADRPAEKKEG